MSRLKVLLIAVVLTSKPAANSFSLEDYETRKPLLFPGVSPGDLQIQVTEATTRNKFSMFSIPTLKTKLSTSTTTKGTLPPTSLLPITSTSPNRRTVTVTAKSRNNIAGNSEAHEKFKATFSFLKNSDAKKFRVHSVNFPDGNYTGELNGIGMRHGWGEMHWRNGTLYGPGGIFIYSRGDRYVGQWKNHKQHGECLSERSISCFPSHTK